MKLINVYTKLLTALLISVFGVSCSVTDKTATEKQVEPVAWWQFDESEGASVRDEVSQRRDTVHYVFTDARFKPDSDPMWREGVSGNGLLFDGYSTWVERPQEYIPTPERQLTLEAWVAPRTYEWGDEGRLSAIINQHDREEAEGYALGYFRHGTWALHAGINGEYYELWEEDQILETGQWSHIAGVIDLEEGLMALYLNGERVAEKQIPSDGQITPADKPLRIGKNSKPVMIGRYFPVNMFTGMMDEVRIYHTALGQEEIRARFQEFSPEFPDLTWYRDRYEGDRHRPQYHYLPPAHWMNEPHAPLHHEDKYHIFYQHNPQGPFWHQIHWGHAVSDDMVHWEDVGIALAPERDEVDPDGVWSGSATVSDDGTPTLFYTAGDDSKEPNQMTAIARSFFEEHGDPRLPEWEKYEGNPVTVQEEGIGIFGQFRDPFVWKDGDTWFQLVGSGVEDEGGTALLYSSEDMFAWQFENYFKVGDVEKFPKTGDVWELPVFLPLNDDKYIFMINPWYFEYSPHNVKYVWYWIGEWDYESMEFTPDHEEPKLFDAGQHFTGPSGMVDEEGRTIVFSIAQDSRPGKHRYDSGWAFNAGLPIILEYRDDKRLGIRPIPELESLREEQLYAFTEPQTVDEINQQLGDQVGDMIEVQAEFEVTGSAKVGFTFRKSPGGEEQTHVWYNTDTEEYKVDREASSKKDEVWKEVQGETVSIDDDIITMHMYLDKSMVEVYMNELMGMTSRVYPTREDALGLELLGDENVTVKSLRIWELGSAYE